MRSLHNPMPAMFRCLRIIARKTRPGQVLGVETGWKLTSLFLRLGLVPRELKSLIVICPIPQLV
jgi:hypothetical protein